MFSCDLKLLYLNEIIHIDSHESSQKKTGKSRFFVCCTEIPI